MTSQPWPGREVEEKSRRERLTQTCVSFECPKYTMAKPGATTLIGESVSACCDQVLPCVETLVDQHLHRFRFEGRS